MFRCYLCNGWQNLPPPGRDRVKVTENLGATWVAPVAPVDTSLCSGKSTGKGNWQNAPLCPVAQDGYKSQSLDTLIFIETSLKLFDPRTGANFPYNMSLKNYIYEYSYKSQIEIILKGSEKQHLSNVKY